MPTDSVLREQQRRYDVGHFIWMPYAPHWGTINIIVQFRAGVIPRDRYVIGIPTNALPPPPLPEWNLELAKSNERKHLRQKKQHRAMIARELRERQGRARPPSKHNKRH